MSSPKLILRGHRELLKKLRRLGDKKQLRRVLRKAVNSGTQELVRGVRAAWPVDEGISKKAVTRKVVKTQGGYLGIVGIDKEAGQDDASRRPPSNIDHLIEFGFQHVGGTTVPANAPLRRGFDATQSAAEQRFITKAKAEVEREATRK